MEPITLATVTSALTMLASEVTKGICGEAGKSLWEEIKLKLGWKQEPSTEDLAPQIASRLQNDEALTQDILKVLQSREEAGYAGKMVGRIDADKVVVADTINVRGNFNM